MIKYIFLGDPNKNDYTFFLSRSNATGRGKYSAHLTEDNYSTSKFLKYYYQKSMNFNLFGMPMFGGGY